MKAYILSVLFAASAVGLVAETAQSSSSAAQAAKIKLPPAVQPSKPTPPAELTVSAPTTQDIPMGPITPSTKIGDIDPDRKAEMLKKIHDEAVRICSEYGMLRYSLIIANEPDKRERTQRRLVAMERMD